MIRFDSQNVDMPTFDFDLIRSWIERVAEVHGRKVKRLSYLFCDDESILDINRQFLQHDYYTDIITFDYSTPEWISGDMVISLDTVRTNADLVSAPFEDELLRVIIHGVLHLCGIDDKGPGEREVMEQHENQALALLGQ